MSQWGSTAGLVLTCALVMGCATGNEDTSAPDGMRTATLAAGEQMSLTTPDSLQPQAFPVRVGGPLVRLVLIDRPQDRAYFSRIDPTTGTVDTSQWVGVGNPLPWQSKDTPAPARLAELREDTAILHVPQPDTP